VFLKSSFYPLEFRMARKRHRYSVIGVPVLATLEQPKECFQTLAFEQTRHLSNI
jgi:hypothetical protein